MSIRLVDAMKETLDGWQDDLEPNWRAVFEDTELGFDAINPALELKPCEPVFPGRKNHQHLGAPKGAHIFRAFEDIGPQNVRCILLGQDPYPCMAFSTGRAFEVGSYSSWRDMERMFSHSMRSFIQCACAARTGRQELAADTAAWKDTIQGIESGEIDLEPPSELAQRWVDQGVLLVNSSLTISRFAVAGDPHQLECHIPLWRPLIVRLLDYFAHDVDKPIATALFGDVAKDAYQDSLAQRHADGSITEAFVVATEHPAAGSEFLKNGNPLAQCNALLESRGEKPIDW